MLCVCVERVGVVRMRGACGVVRGACGCWRVDVVRSSVSESVENYKDLLCRVFAQYLFQFDVLLQ